MIILALDLASVTGWACGEPGAIPAHGSVRFAKAGASHEAIFAKAAQWMNGALVAHVPSLIVWEAPMPTSFSRGRTTSDTTTILHGLPAVVGAVAYLKGIFDIRKAETRDVRNHFIGSNPKRAKAKPLTIQKCRSLGLFPSDDNAADAIATWFYMCALIEPATALRTTALFGRRVHDAS